MLGVCSTIARVGGVAAPWIAVYLSLWTGCVLTALLSWTINTDLISKKIALILLQGTLNAAVPLYIFGGASSLAGVVAALALRSPLGHLCPKTLRWPTILSWSSCTDDICPSLGLEKDEGERQAYLEVHLAKEEGERGGGRGRVKSSSRGIEQGQRISEHLWWYFKAVAIYVMIAHHLHILQKLRNM